MINQKEDSTLKFIRTFGFFPESSQSNMEERYKGITGQLSKVLGYHFIFETRLDYPRYMTAIENEAFDIAVVNAFDYVKIKNRTRYIPILYRSDSLTATFVSRDKNLNNLLDLKNKKIGFSSRYSSASISAQYMFLKNDMFSDDYEQMYFNGHIPCLDAVYDGVIDVCVTGERIFSKYSPLKKFKLSVILQGEPLPQLVVLMHPNLHKDKADIVDFFLNLKNTDDGKLMLDETYLVVLKIFQAEKYYVCELLLDYISSHE
ncbi:MAG: PhnD/SsuA/transferrin family substrate-binding protein [Cellvibrionaceae bacterium]